jgi:mono/diheme cytochrome c family protein
LADAGATTLLSGWSIAAGAGGPAAGETPLSREDGQKVLKGACLSCHSEEMLVQQRLTPGQWAKVVTQMVAWGANIEPQEIEPFTAWLAATYGVDAGPYEPTRIASSAAAAAIAPLPDGPFANGDAENGRAVYTEKCSGCHGMDARGRIGTVLVDRPLLYRAAEVAETIRRGRGKMAPISMPDHEVADVLAHLRGIKNP